MVRVRESVMLMLMLGVRVVVVGVMVRVMVRVRVRPRVGVRARVRVGARVGEASVLTCGVTEVQSARTMRRRRSHIEVDHTLNEERSVSDSGSSWSRVDVATKAPTEPLTAPGHSGVELMWSRIGLRSAIREVLFETNGGCAASHDDTRSSETIVSCSSAEVAFEVSGPAPAGAPV